MHRTALVAGATGLVGRNLVDLLLDDMDVAEVVTLTRQPLALPHPKLRQCVVDFAQLRDFALPPVHDFYCCLGTTIRRAGSQWAFREVDLVYPTTIAQMALSAGATHCVHISAMGADPASRVFYNRIKGEVEGELDRLPFRVVVALRPSLLVGKRKEFRPAERAALAVLRPLSFLLPARFRPVDAAAVARVMVVCARASEDGHRVVESEEIRQIAARR
jgi:uncharacterized protein YbjT (DUF2867 family)